MVIPYSSELKEPSKILRANMTLAEKSLWERINRRQIRGYRFCRQKPLGNFIVDFYCQKAKLVIEVDGEIHLKRTIKESDQNKDKFFNSIGLSVLRFTNKEIFTNIGHVIETIKQEIPLGPP
ncbi:MAG: DUF559 domain-containing protein [Dehalococcoidales bacterium]